MDNKGSCHACVCRQTRSTQVHRSADANSHFNAFYTDEVLSQMVDMTIIYAKRDKAKHGFQLIWLRCGCFGNIVVIWLLCTTSAKTVLGEFK